MLQALEQPYDDARMSKDEFVAMKANEPDALPFSSMPVLASTSRSSQILAFSVWSGQAG